MKRKHKPSDKAKRLSELISLKQPDAVAPSDKNIASMMKGMSFIIGRKGKQTDATYDKTSDDGKY